MTKAEIKTQLEDIITNFEPTIGDNENLDNSQLLGLCNPLASKLSEINNPNSTHYPPTPVH